MAHDSYFASDLGLTPGSWPFTILIGGVTYTRLKQVLYGGEFAGYDYKHIPTGFVVTVFND